ncbi:MAG: hypothetical protein ABIG44_19605 [Planctomycetota bacterium]
MSWLLDAINWTLLTLGAAAQWLWNDGLSYLSASCAFLGEMVNPICAPLLTWINLGVNAIAGVLLAPIGMMPGWLSNTIISALTGVLLLIVFKYTSNQPAIGRVKDYIKVNLLTLKLFKDDLGVTFRAQGRVFLGALWLLGYSVKPLLVMILPVALGLGQMGLWYQQRPLHSGEEALVTMELAGAPQTALPAARIVAIPGAEVSIGPVRVFSKRQVCWQIRARQSGRHRIIFEVDGQRVEKELAIGTDFMRVSAVRPPRDWTALLLHPLERPFAQDSLVQSISIEYPPRVSWTSGTDWWLAYFFVAAMVFALIFKPFLKVKL